MLKVRRYDFSTLTRSETLRGPTDDPAVVREAAGRLLDSVDTTGGVRLLGVGVSGLADFTQEDLFAQAAGERAAEERRRGGAESGRRPRRPPRRRRLRRTRRSGAGWPGTTCGTPSTGRAGCRAAASGGSPCGSRRPTSTEPGRVRTFRVDDPGLEPAEPLPLVAKGQPEVEAAAGRRQERPECGSGFTVRRACRSPGRAAAARDRGPRCPDRSGGRAGAPARGRGGGPRRSRGRP